jgi:hypothetical protein
MRERQERFARRLADGLGRRAARVPVRRMRWYVVFFFGGMVGVNVVLVGRTLVSHTDRPVRLQVIKPAGLPAVLRAKPPDLWGLLDSMRRVPDGKQVFDSIVESRPRLADTLRWMEGLR